MFTSKMLQLSLTSEAKVFYLSNRLMQGDFVEAQQGNGIDPPKIRLDFEYAKQYYRVNNLAQRDMDLIVEELIEVGRLDER